MKRDLDLKEELDIRDQMWREELQKRDEEY